MNKKHFSKHIKDFDFKNLFINLGWDNYADEISIAVDGSEFNLKGIAQKRGFVIVVCLPEVNGDIPLSAVRKKIETCFRKYHHEHLIIYDDHSHTKQIWQFVIQENDKPRRVREIPYNINQDPEMLYQRLRGLFFTLEEEERITLVDVTARVRENLAKNSEKVTKKFYTEFTKHHSSFLGFIEGIDDLIMDEDNKNKQWYASIMMNRLMFCYFIQKRGYLDNNINYLQNKLKEVKQKAGKNKFYNFYREFLLQLFHQGLGTPEKERHLNVDLGKIPYLNGGLFDIHELERKFDKIQINDQAFEKVFNFFDQWNWHLDTRIEASGRDINPDVIGYIFEKYVNDRAAMGAYYTKEDITGYIGKNTIIPSLFDKVRREYPKAFEKNGYIWSFLKNSGDTYVYDAVKKGIPSEGGLFDDLPEDIKKGFNSKLEKKIVDNAKPQLCDIRKPWNQKAPSDIALPTEIYRELIERRKRYVEIKEKIEQGEVTEINDFITHNLNIRQFIQDILENTDNPDLIKHFFKSIAGNIKHKEENEKIIRPISILDPTCGSGAFLFAAMNILEPLYEACIEKMEQFTAESPRKYKFFHKVLADANSEEHPNLQYYIYKSIILNNLYGVDIMNEAVEIAKLRLFLKMVGAVDINLRKPNFGLEPLPDIDFNIKAGNTLVGFATLDELKKSQEKRLDYFNAFEKIDDECKIVAVAYRNFQNSQIVTDKNSYAQRKAKIDLQKRLDVLNDKLNGYLASTYGIMKYEDFGGNSRLFNSDDTLKQHTKEYKKWLESHQPFHWFAEFYEIINENDGFDVVIGNPPYVQLSKIKYNFLRELFKSIKGNNLYSLIIERTFKLLSDKSFIGMIVPVSICSSKKFTPLMKILFKKKNWISSFSNRPGKLFNGVEQRLSIFILKNIDGNTHSSSYQHWYQEERNFLFKNLKFEISSFLEYRPLKIGSLIEKSCLEKIMNGKFNIPVITGNIGETWYHDGPTYWVRSLPFKPKGNQSDKSSHYHCIRANSIENSFLITAILASSTFYLFYKSFSNCRDLGLDSINSFIFNSFNKKYHDIIRDYETILKDTSKRCSREYDSGYIEYDEFYPAKCKGIIDYFDYIFSHMYGFAEEELDFIINYDIKYRMGEELFNKENEKENEQLVKNNNSFLK
jgi:hypothetical protein